MGTKSRYRVQVNPAVSSEDVPALPIELQEDFNDICQSVLTQDPHTCMGLPCHPLKGELKGYRALETEWNGIAYRLIYRVYESPAPRRVVIVSFGEHDPAYDNAQKRINR